MEKINDVYLFPRTAGTQCFARSAPFPFKISTDLHEDMRNNLVSYLPSTDTVQILSRNN